MLPPTLQRVQVTGWGFLSEAIPVGLRLLRMAF